MAVQIGESRSVARSIRWPAVARFAGLPVERGLFAFAVMQLSNPQSYDPHSHLLLSTLLVTVALLAFVLVQALFPTTDAQRRRWALDAARREMRAALRNRGSMRPEDENGLLDATRIGTLAGLKGTEPAEIAPMLRMADLARVARRVRRGLDRLALPAPVPGRPARDLGRVARAALAATHR